MSGNAFVPIRYDKDSNGKLFKSRNRCWVFRLCDKEHKLEFVKSTLGKMKVILDGEVMVDHSNLFQQSFRYPFTLENYNFVLYEDKQDYDLSCDGVQFSVLLNGGSQNQSYGNNQGNRQNPSRGREMNIPQGGVNLLGGGRVARDKAFQKKPDPAFMNDDFGGEFSNKGKDFEWRGFGGGGNEWANQAPPPQGQDYSQGNQGGWGGGGSGGNDAGNPFAKEIVGVGSDGKIAQTFDNPFQTQEKGFGNQGCSNYQSNSNSNIQSYGSDAQKNNDIFDQFGREGTGGSGLLNKNKQKSNRFGFIFGGGKKKSAEVKGLSSNEFDLQYQAFVRKENEKGGTLHKGVRTEIINRIPVHDDGKRRKFHTPFEAIDLDEKARNIAKGAGKLFRKSEAALETFERGVKGLFKGLLNPTRLDQNAENEFESETVISEMGTDLHRINKGFGGEELELGDFKFDDKFGGEYMKQKQYEEKERNKLYGQGAQGGYGNNDPFSSFGNQQGHSGGQQDYSRGQPPQENFGQQGGFLDFDTAFDSSNQHQPQTANPFA